MSGRCPSCWKELSTLANVRCAACHAAAVARIRAKEALPVGGASSLDEDKVPSVPTCCRRPFDMQMRDSIKRRRASCIEEQNPSTDDAAKALEDGGR